MKKTVLLFGLASGGVLALLAAIVLPLTMDGVIHRVFGEVFGYTSMVLAFLAVFFGIRSYRDRHQGGSISFGKAFQVGILITLVTCAIYVIGWQITYWGFMPDFWDKYAVMALDQLRAEGASQAEIAKETAKMDQFKRWSASPVLNVTITFLEIFPVGLIMTLVSAAILRRKGNGSAAAERVLA